MACVGRGPEQTYRPDCPQIRVLDFLGDGWLLWTRATPTKPLQLTSIPRPFLPMSPHWNYAVFWWPTKGRPFRVRDPGLFWG